MSATLEPLVPGRLLVVDDEPSTLERLLEFEFSIRTARSLADADHALREEEFDVVLTDCGMSGESRQDLVQLVNARFPGVIVIVLAGADLAEIEKLETPQSIVRLLPRPYDTGRLIGWVTSTMKLARMSQVTGRVAKKYPSHLSLNTAGLEPKPYPLRAVVVDADPAQREGYTTRLAGFANANGYQGALVGFAEDRLGLLVHLNDHPVHIVILDASALGNQTEDWLLQARATPGHSQVPILLFGEAQRLSRSRGEDAHLVTVPRDSSPVGFIRGLNALMWP